MINDIMYSRGHGKECARDKLWCGRPARTGTVGRESDRIPTDRASSRRSSAPQLIAGALLAMPATIHYIVYHCKQALGGPPAFRGRHREPFSESRMRSLR